MKNKVSISMVSLFCLMLAGGAYEAQACVGADCPEGTGPTDTNTGGSNTNTTGGSNKSIAEGGYWSQVDALTANDKLMEIAYNDTLVRSDGAKARDKALSALNKALAAQKKYDDEVKTDMDKMYGSGWGARSKYDLGAMTDAELSDYLSKQEEYAYYESLIEKEGPEKYGPELEVLKKAKEEGLYDSQLVDRLKKNPNISREELYAEYDKEHGDQDYRSDVTEIAKEIHREELNKEKANPVYEANKALTEAMTPEVKDAIRGELGVADGAAVNQALSDPKAKQALQNRLDNMQTKYSDFPKVDLDTQEGQSLLHSMVGTTNAGGLGTVKSDGSSITVQTTEEAERAAREALDNPVYNPGSGYTDSLNNSSNAAPGLGNDATVE